MVAHLERHPLSKEAQGYRAMLLRWLTSDQPGGEPVTVICAGSIPDPGALGKYQDELLGQDVIAQAKWLILNPGQTGYDPEAQLAGLESVLRTYVSMRTLDRGACSRFLDELLTKQREGKLAAYVVEGKAKCMPPPE